MGAAAALDLTSLSDRRPPRVAQQLLRHASSETTTETYSHVTAAQERRAWEVLEAALVG